MQCPFCGDKEDKVIDRRESKEGDSIRRRAPRAEKTRKDEGYEKKARAPAAWAPCAIMPPPVLVASERLRRNVRTPRLYVGGGRRRGPQDRFQIAEARRAPEYWKENSQSTHTCCKRAGIVTISAGAAIEATCIADPKVKFCRSGNVEDLFGPGTIAGQAVANKEGLIQEGRVRTGRGAGGGGVIQGRGRRAGGAASANEHTDLLSRPGVTRRRRVLR